MTAASGGLPCQSSSMNTAEDILLWQATFGQKRHARTPRFLNPEAFMNFVQRRHLISPLLACSAFFVGQIAQAAGPTSQEPPHNSPTAFNCSMRHHGSFRDVFFSPLGVTAPANERASLALLKLRADEIAQDKECCPVVGWWINGHADPREASTQQAEQLSQARADYISRLVVGLGVPASNICMRAQGARQPVAEPPSPKNIRVEMVVSCLNPQRPFCE